MQSAIAAANYRGLSHNHTSHKYTEYTTCFTRQHNSYTERDTDLAVLSLRPSSTLWYFVKKTELIIKQSTLHSSLWTIVFSHQRIWWNVSEVAPNVAPNTCMVEKNPPFFTSISTRSSYLFKFHRSSFGGFWDIYSPPRQRSANTETLTLTLSWCCPGLVLVALWNRADHYIFALWFLNSSFFCYLSIFSSPNISRRILDVCHTSTPHMVWP